MLFNDKSKSIAIKVTITFMKEHEIVFVIKLIIVIKFFVALS